MASDKEAQYKEEGSSRGNLHPPEVNPNLEKETDGVSTLSSDSSDHTLPGGGHSSEEERERPALSKQTSAKSITRSISEVRDGILSQRDPELGQTEEEQTAGTEKVNPKDGGEEPDPNLVSWEGPDDPENPLNWPNSRKWAAIFTLSTFTLLSPVASSMVAPDLQAIGHDLHINSTFEQALVLSIFVLAYALGPLVWGPLSELYGRKINMQISNFWFLCFNLGCGLARTKGQMIAFRLLSGIGGSAPLAIGGGTLADVFTADERGKALSIYSLMPLLGPALGPVAGGWIAERTTWRWVFYSTTIASVAIQIIGYFLLQETYAPVLLGWKKQRLIKETGNTKLHTKWDRPDRTLAQILSTALTRPFRLLYSQPIVQVLALYMAFLYGSIYLVISSFPAIWRDVYNESVGIAGLNYISLGIGFWVGAQISAYFQDRIYAHLKRRYITDGGPGKPEFRVPMMIPGAIMVPIGLIMFGWTAEAKTHWIVPNIASVIFAAGTIASFQCLQGYLVDCYTLYAASAVGAGTVLRSMAGFGFPLFAPAMYEKLGFGWGCTVLGVGAIVVGWPAPIALWFYGPKLRAKSKFAV